MTNDLKLIIGSDSPIGGIVTSEEYSQRSLEILHRLVEFDTEDIVDVLSSIVNGEERIVKDISVSDIAEVVAEYRVKRNNFFRRGVETFDGVGKEFMGMNKPDLLYVIESVDRETGVPLPKVEIPYRDIEKDLEVLPEDLVARAYVSISPDGIPGKVTGSFVVLKPENVHLGIEEMVYRAKSPPSLSNKLANLHTGARLADQVANNPDIVKDDQAFVMVVKDLFYPMPSPGNESRSRAYIHTLVAGNSDLAKKLTEETKRRLSNMFPPIYYDSKSQELRLVQTDKDLDISTNGKHLIKPGPEKPVWRFIKTNPLKGRWWEGYQAILMMSKGLYEIQLQTRKKYESGKRDHEAYKARQTENLSPEALNSRNIYQQKLHHLLFYLGMKNIPQERLEQIPGLIGQIRAVEQIYRITA